MERGLRLAFVAFAEELYKISQLDIDQTPPSSTKLLELMTVQKYLETPLWDFVFEEEQLVLSMMEKRHFNIWLCVMALGCLLVLLFLLIWFQVLTMLKGRLVRCRQILGFIPLRVMLRNKPLTA